MFTSPNMGLLEAFSQCGSHEFFQILLHWEWEIEEKVTEEVGLFLSWKMPPVVLGGNFLAKQIQHIRLLHNLEMFLDFSFPYSHPLHFQASVDVTGLDNLLISLWDKSSKSYLKSKFVIKFCPLLIHSFITNFYCCFFPKKHFYINIMPSALTFSMVIKSEPRTSAFAC